MKTFNVPLKPYQVRKTFFLALTDDQRREVKVFKYRNYWITLEYKNFKRYQIQIVDWLSPREI